MGIYILVLFIGCAIYVQMRGKVVHAKLSRRLTDHSNFLAPANCLFYAFSFVRNKPYLDLDEFPQLQVLQDNWEVIRDEALALNDQAQIKASVELDDLGFNSFFRTGWKRFYLKWYSAHLKSAEALCPRTVAMIDAIPSIKGAMFAMLPPGARLVKHRDPFAGSLRYHLGLVTPNSPGCFINVDGEDYYWKDGEAVMFDETFIHYAENKTGQNRIILFLDVRRPVWFAPVDWFNSLFSAVILRATATKNMEGDRVGFLNRIFARVYVIRALGKKLKAWNKPVYYLAQCALYVLLIWLIIF